ncbi:MAG: diguanylate cyclase [Candidatus Eremiobacterota bacterium]
MKFGSKTFISLVFITVLILFLSSLLINNYIVSSFFNNNKQLALSQSEILARQVNHLVESKEQLIILLGTFALTDYISVRDGKDKKMIEKKRKEAELKFKLFSEQYSSFNELRFIDEKGDVLIKILDGKIVDRPGENLSDRDYFKSLFASGEEKKKRYKYISSVFKAEQVSINMACLVNYKGHDTGIIVGTYNLEDIHDLFNETKFKRMWFVEDSFPWLIGIDNEKKPLLISYPEKYNSDPNMIGLIEEDKEASLRNGLLTYGYGCISYTSRDGKKRIVAFAPVNKTLGWSVSLSIPYNKFISSGKELQIKITVILFISLLLLIICFCSVIFYFSRGLTLLAFDIDTLIDMEQESQIHIKGNDELAQIGAGVNRLNQKYLDIKSNSSMDMNSITNLPGNFTVQKKLFDIIDSGSKFAVTMVDIDNFNVYNQRYGFPKGDSVIRMTATLVTNTVKESGNKEDFVGHLGGDDIIFITTPDKVDKICEEIISSFDKQILLYYTEEDRQKGGFAWRDKEGTIKKFPLMTLSIAVSTNEKRQIIHPLQISQIFSELLVYLKKRPGSKYFRDRRIRDRKPLSSETASIMRQEDSEDSAGNTSVSLSEEGHEPEDTPVTEILPEDKRDRVLTVSEDGHKTEISPEDNRNVSDGTNDGE